MGASIAEGGFDEGEDFAEAHDINVTPFIDVILVLLIIFMVAAPLSTVDLPIDLPTSTATPQKKPDKPTYVSIKPDLAIAIGILLSSIVTARVFIPALTVLMGRRAWWPSRLAKEPVPAVHPAPVPEPEPEPAAAG